MNDDDEMIIRKDIKKNTKIEIYLQLFVILRAFFEYTSEIVGVFE